MVVGLICSLLSAALSVSGNLVEKRAVGSMADLNLRQIRSALITLLRSRVWLLGVILSLGAAFVQALAFAKAPIAIVQTAFGAGLVVLITISHFHWHETIQKREMVGLAIAVVALVSAGLSLDGGGDVIGSASSPALVALVSAVTIAAVGALVLVPQKSTGRMGVEFGIASGLLYGVSGVATKGIATVIRHRTLGSSGIPILTSAYLYIFVIAAAGALVTFQIGIQRGRLGIVAPISNVLASAYVVAVGMLVFDESLPSNALALTLRLVGIVGMLIGTAVVATGSNKSIHTSDLPDNPAAI